MRVTQKETATHARSMSFVHAHVTKRGIRMCLLAVRFVLLVTEKFSFLTIMDILPGYLSGELNRRFSFM